MVHKPINRKTIVQNQRTKVQIPHEHTAEIDNDRIIEDFPVIENDIDIYYPDENDNQSDFALKLKDIDLNNKNNDQPIHRFSFKKDKWHKIENIIKNDDGICSLEKIPCDGYYFPNPILLKDGELVRPELTEPFYQESEIIHKEILTSYLKESILQHNIINTNNMIDYINTKSVLRNIPDIHYPIHTHDGDLREEFKQYFLENYGKKVDDYIEENIFKEYTEKIIQKDYENGIINENLTGNYQDDISHCYRVPFKERKIEEVPENIQEMAKEILNHKIENEKIEEFINKLDNIIKSIQEFSEISDCAFSPNISISLPNTVIPTTFLPLDINESMNTKINIQNVLDAFINKKSEVVYKKILTSYFTDSILQQHIMRTMIMIDYINKNSEHPIEDL